MMPEHTKADPFLFVANAHAIVCGREVRPGDVIAVRIEDGRMALSIELPFNPQSVLNAADAGTLTPHEDADARLAAAIRPAHARDPRVIPFPLARRTAARTAQ